MIDALYDALKERKVRCTIVHVTTPWETGLDILVGQHAPDSLIRQVFEACEEVGVDPNSVCASVQYAKGTVIHDRLHVCGGPVANYRW